MKAAHTRTVVAIVLFTFAVAHAPAQSLTAVGVLAGYHGCRVPSQRLTTAGFHETPSVHQSSLGITSFKTFHSWVGSVSMNLYPGRWRNLDTVALDERASSVVLEGGYLLRRTGRWQVFPLVGVGRWTFREQVRRLEPGTAVTESHQFSSMVADLSINAYYVPYSNRSETNQRSTLVGMKLGWSTGLSARDASAPRAELGRGGIQTVYIQLMIAGFAWRSPKPLHHLQP